MALTEKQIIKALRQSAGFITEAAKKLNVGHSAICHRIKKSKALQNALYEIKESHLDFTESKLIANIKEGKEASIFFYLKCQGKQRGYVEKQEIEHSGSITGKLDKEQIDAINEALRTQKT